MSERPFSRITVNQLCDWLDARPDALVLDARAERDRATGYLAGSRVLDRDSGDQLLMGSSRRRPVLIYCYHGNASQTWAGMFADFGFKEVVDLVGGWTALGPAGFPGARTLDDLRGALQPAAPATAVKPVDPWLADWLRAEGFDAEDPSRPARHGNTPLMHAAWRGAHHAVDALLAHGVPLDAVNNDGNNALWLACVNGEPGLIRALVAKGVPMDHLNLTGATALMYAASAGKPGVVATLLELGANPAVESQDGFTALDMCASLECLQLLRPKRNRPVPDATAA